MNVKATMCALGILISGYLHAVKIEPDTVQVGKSVYFLAEDDEKCKPSAPFIEDVISPQMSTNRSFVRQAKVRSSSYSEKTSRRRTACFNRGASRVGSAYIAQTNFVYEQKSDSSMMTACLCGIGFVGVASLMYMALNNTNIQVTDCLGDVNIKFLGTPLGKVQVERCCGDVNISCEGISWVAWPSRTAVVSTILGGLGLYCGSK